MKEFFIDISKVCAKTIATDGLLDSVSESTKVPMRLHNQRLHVTADDATTAVAAVCKLITSHAGLAIKMNNSNLQRGCDWAAMLNRLYDLNGSPIATSSSLNEADVIHAFREFSKGRNDSDLFMREYALWSWKLLSGA